MRTAVEQLAIEMAIENKDEETMQKLREQLEVINFYTEQKMSDRLLQANEEFHNLIYQMTKSRFIVQVLKSYQDYVHLARKSTLSKETNLPEIYQEHVQILETLEAGDIERAKEVVAKHLDGSAHRAFERWIEKK